MVHAHKQTPFYIDQNAEMDVGFEKHRCEIFLRSLTLSVTAYRADATFSVGPNPSVHHTAAEFLQQSASYDTPAVTPKNLFILAYCTVFGGTARKALATAHVHLSMPDHNSARQHLVYVTTTTTHDDDGC